MVGAIPNIEIRRLSGALGAEVEGVDLGQIDAAAFSAIYEAFLVHQMLVFPGQKLDADAYTALATRRPGAWRSMSTARAPPISRA